MALLETQEGMMVSLRVVVDGDSVRVFKADGTEIEDVVVEMTSATPEAVADVEHPLAAIADAIGLTEEAAPDATTEEGSTEGDGGDTADPETTV